MHRTRMKLACLKPSAAKKNLQNLADYDVVNATPGRLSPFGIKILNDNVCGTYKQQMSKILKILKLM